MLTIKLAKILKFLQFIILLPMIFWQYGLGNLSQLKDIVNR
ncbi:DUF2949 domain-containing protein [Calothrix rhizosoleniae]